MSEKTLYERSLEALVAQLETENAKLRAAMSDGERRKERRSEEVERGQSAASALAREPHDASAALPFLESAPHVTSRPAERAASDPIKRAGEAEKRSFLVSAGWTDHPDIYAQNVSACWEHGAKWQTLDDAYEVAMTEKAKTLLLSTGWVPSVGEADEIERWSKGLYAAVPFHIALQAASPSMSRALHPTAYVNGAT